MKRRSIFASGSALALAAVVPGCGSGSSSTSGTGRLRLLNACVGYANLGMTVDTSTTVSPVAFGSVSSYGSYKAGSIVIPEKELTLLKTLRNQALLAIKQSM